MPKLPAQEQKDIVQGMGRRKGFSGLDANHGDVALHFL